MEFALRMAVKGQILVDFMVKCSFQNSIDPSVLLIDPTENEWKYGLSFGFQTSNNAIEYEALLSGLQLARQLGVKDLVVHINSQLMVK
ncbi:rve domain-containing protein/RVT_3 domain-containing protein [Gossypium australe]|uniref:Rve domain-containing protein/RVT_3 domain-containing protein n=1 Tax=Gossypium australe TaxID=47621 RepID=A0A5B6W8K1_9ROSI|nr:rve domain-containing protein/RVT_3 domain-containing protein [Gossypium australe]